MDREKIEAYNREQRKRTLDFLIKSDCALDERISGLDAIRREINPYMSRTTFYRRHRRGIDFILFEDIDHWRTGRPRFFTTRRLLYYYMIGRRKI